jgi:hypothetical protein
MNGITNNEIFEILKEIPVDQDNIDIFKVVPNQMSIIENLNLTEPIKIPSICEDVKCKKKLSILDKELKCKCGKIFCPEHKFFKSHNCTYDYKSEYDKKIMQQNPKLGSHKIDKL